MKRLILNIITAALIMVPSLAPSSMVYACSAGSAASQSKAEVIKGASIDGSDCNGEGRINDIVSTAVNILSYIVGIAATIMIIVAGFFYITSSGDANKVGNAKNTLVYALVGVVVAALAQFMVHFVLHKVGK